MSEVGSIQSLVDPVIRTNKAREEINLKKCQNFIMTGKRQRKKLGTNKSSDSISAEHSYATASRHSSDSGLQAPVDRQGLHSFLRDCEKYTLDIPEYDVVTRPLFEVVADKKFIWDDHCQMAYDHLQTYMKEFQSCDQLNSSGDSKKNRIRQNDTRKSDDKSTNDLSDDENKQQNSRSENENLPASSGHEASSEIVKEVVDALTAIKKSMAQLVDEFGSQHSKSHFSHRNQDASEDEGRLLISREVPRKYTRRQSAYQLTKNDENSSSESECETHSTSTPSTSLLCQKRINFKHGSLKIPPFTGKESWKVWINRFEETTDRIGLNADEKLDELLPKLHGIAGDFVFGQLPKRSRQCYESLITELSNRFRIIENTKSMAVKFSHRDQKVGESIEDYAASLKEIYDKAFMHRDQRTRNEDLLRRFMDGLLDEKAKFEVEYVKDPTTIDEAVLQVITYLETKNRMTKYRKSTRMLKIENEENKEDEVENIGTSHQSNLLRLQNKGKEPTMQTGYTHHSKKTILPESKDDLLTSIEKLEKRMKSLEDSQRDGHPQPKHQHIQQEERTCFQCGKVGHIKRDCRLPRTLPHRSITQPNSGYRNYFASRPDTHHLN